MRSQFVTASWGGRRNEPFAFTEHGVLMLSSVLNNQRAIQVNIRIMRVFNQRGYQQIEYIDRLQEKQDSSQTIQKTKREIGFKIGESNIKSMEQ